LARYLLVPKPLAERFAWLSRAVQTLEGVLLRAVFRLLGALSPERAIQLAGGVFALVGPWSQKAIKAERNLEIAFPQHDLAWRKRTVRGIFRSLGWAAGELVKLEQIWRERDRRLRFTADAAAAELLAQRAPCVFVCAHVGAWQLTNLIARQYGLEITTVYAPESNPVVAQALGELRSAFGVSLLPTEAGARPLLRELKAGRSIGLAVDTRLPTGELLPFFGREALTNTTAARLALRAGAQLVPIHCRRTGAASFHVHVSDPLRPSQDLDHPDDPDALARDLSRQVNALFETWIRETPEQWICLKRRWPKAHKL
jgi:KDO2-lipid IV(A) lauroyltransferase